MENVFSRRFAIRRLGSIVAASAYARRIQWREETHASNGSARQRRFAIRRLGSIVVASAYARRIQWREETHASNGSARDRPSSLTISSGLFQDSDQAAVVTIMAVPTKEVMVRSIHLRDAKVVAVHLVVDGRYPSG